MLKKIIQALYEKLVRINNPFYDYGIPREDYSINDGTLNLKKLNLEFAKHEGESVLRGYPFALKIQQAVGGKFTVEGGKVFLKIRSLTFQINSSEEIFIVYEVFVTGAYRYNCLRETVFVDIGMNSGITTLFYAQDPLVKKVYAYELFRPTFLFGMQNLHLNSDCASKVHAFNYGLSNRTFHTTLDYSVSRKGRMGLNGLPSDENFPDATSENVVVMDIVQVFEEIIPTSLMQDLVVKIDCEGEEFNLIESLSNSGQLGMIAVVMIEWHYLSPTRIEDCLKSFGFHVFSQTLPGLNSGMIYAVGRKP